MKDKSFIDKLIELQQEFVGGKTENNDFGGFKYRNIEKMLAELKPMLKAKDLYIRFTDEVVNLGDRYYVKATATISDGQESADAQAFAREEFEKKKSDASQLTGAASTYARKYALCGLLGVDDGSNDPDSKDNDREHYNKPVVTDAKQLSTKHATDKQIKLIFDKLKEAGSKTKEDALNVLASEYGIADITKLTIEDASILIEELIDNGLDLSQEAYGDGKGND